MTDNDYVPVPKWVIRRIGAAAITLSMGFCAAAGVLWLSVHDLKSLAESNKETANKALATTQFTNLMVPRDEKISDLRSFTQRLSARLRSVELRLAAIDGQHAKSAVYRLPTRNACVALGGRIAYRGPLRR